MADLLGQNIGQNYKGLLNIGVAVNTPLDGSLKVISDGMGNNSPLSLSTSIIGIASATEFSWIATPMGLANRTTFYFDTLGRLAWKNGTGFSRTFDALGITANRVYTLPDADGTIALLSNIPAIPSFGLKTDSAINSTLQFVKDFTNVASILQLGLSQVGVQSTIARASGTNTDNPLLLSYTINNTGGTNTVTGLRINATETAIVGTTHNLIDLQVGGVSQFLVSRSGGVTALGTIISSANINCGGAFGFVFSGRGSISAPSGGVFLLTNNAGNDFGRLQFGGTTNLFPAIKRSGTGIDFRLADDSAFCNISANNVIVNSGSSIGISNGSRAITFDSTGATNLYTAFGGHRFSVFNTSTYIDLITITGNTLTPSVGIGTTTPSARLHVRGDGTNPIARFEDSSGTLVFSVNNTNIFAVRPLFLDQITGYSSSNISINANTITTSSSTITTGSFSTLSVVSSIGSATGNANYRPLSLAYTINNSGVQTGTATGLFLNATETALNGMSHNLMDLQRDGVSRFLVTRLGVGIFSGGITQLPELTMNASGIMAFSGRIRIKSPSTNAVMFQDNTETSAANLILGLQTNAFPMIKRNGATIDFRLADDSNFCNLSANSYFGYGQTLTSGVGSFGTFSPNASAQLDITSTTKGFLPPRMTNAQRVAITSPAIGLIVYCTDVVEGLYVNKSTGWTFVI
jgi:hypothetical protein